ncbi:MAG: isoleucine--tRNA ligase [Actinomycetes bacterium]
MYRAVPAQIDLPALEHEVLRLWREQKTFEASLAQTADGPRWTFYEGPPTANGTPGTHHVEARVFKDIFPRFKTMKGYHVPRKAGWDCHGLPVEIAVEKELGFSGKGDIEAYGVAAFNARCKESVLGHVDDFERMTERMAYWVDLSQAYWTMDADYIDSVWWSLQRIHERGLLVEDHRVTPYCPRCGTGLSDHELAQGYETIVDPSVFVRFPVVTGPIADLGGSLLVWTTTPWTLVSNTAVAANPGVEYVVARTSDGEVLVVAEPLLSAVLGDDVERLDVVAGSDLVGTRYTAPFTLVDVASSGTPDQAANVHQVLPAAYVTVEDGTGLVHLAPAFGPEDLAVGRLHGLPVVNPVQPDGRFDDGLDLVGGVFFKKADAALVADLEARGLLFRHLPYEHTYPHCWRCHTALLFYAQPSWYIRTTAVKDDLVRENEATHWYPATIKHGRYGDWLDNNVDWALSRNRYWGTPLPVWRCDEGHLTVIGSRAELGARAGLDLADLDPHRPFVDEITIPCSTCAATAHRVPEVIDVWYDSGAMPFAQWGFPHTNVETFEASYPADYICEAIDQTRGWFYTLMAIGTLVFDRSSYRNVLCLGHILDKDGRKMSKHLGNVLAPMPLMEEHGADAVRWFMLAGGSPWSSRRIGHESMQEVVRKVLLTYWNTVAFHALYARLSGFDPAASEPVPVNDRPVLDRWVVSEVHRLARDVDTALEDFDTQGAGRLIAAFIDDLSNWYVRRSRRRFWRGDTSALATLHEVLKTLTLLMAPFVPFITERVWQDLIVATEDAAPSSVHLARWPAPDATVIDDTLSTQVDLIRRLVELGRAARAHSGIKTRQPLPRALVGAPGWDDVPDELRGQLTDELNVVEVSTLGADAGDLVDVTVKANFGSLGKRFGKRTPVVAAAVASADAAALAAALRERGAATVSVAADHDPAAHEDVELTPEDVVVTETPREGWAVAHDAGESLALDLTVTPPLRRLGLARECVRVVQETRKTTGLEVADRIRLWWNAPAGSELEQALQEHGQLLADEVLAVELIQGAPSEPGVQHHATDLGLTFWLDRA